MGVIESGLTVGQAGGCDTSIVAGLTNQLVAEVNCIAPNAMVNFTDPDARKIGRLDDQALERVLREWRTRL